VFIWKCLDGKHTLKDMTNKLRQNCKDMPADAGKYIKEFVQDMIKKGFVK
jgi:hypothetical protein